MDAIATQIQAQGNVMWVAPAASRSLPETHAALVTSSTTFTNDVNYRGTTRTVRQLRQNNSPNAWEVPWLVWNFKDNTHFYYVVLKPGGWELGKEDPAYPGAQRFLASGSNISFPVGSWNTFDITHNQASGAMTVTVNGALLVSFTDKERPYTSGKVGFYAEDAEVELDGVAGNINDSFEGYASQSFTDGYSLGPWVVNFLGYGSGGIRSLQTSAATPPPSAPVPITSPFSPKRKSRNY